MKLFGYTFFERDADNQSELKSITPDVQDGAVLVDVTGQYDAGVGEAYGYSLSFDVDAAITSEQQLIAKYREISLIPEVEYAVDDIINEMVVTTENQVVTIDLDELNYSSALKTKITNEFKYILDLLNFNNKAFNVLKRWYVDGRLHYQVVIDPNKYADVGISKLTYIDPRLIKKVKVVKKEKDLRTGADTYKDVDEYYLYSDNGFGANLPGQSMNMSEQGVKMSKDSVVQCNSGLLNPTNTIVLSYLHKAIRPLSQLRSMEDAAIIYRMTRAPERRVFYIDVGNLPPAKAEQVLRRQMQQYRSKAVYDVASGTIKSDPRQMIMTEDYFLPRRAGGTATEITTLPGGQNQGVMEEIEYLLNKLYRSLGVPISRMDPQSGFNFGRVTEISRDELKFMKFIDRLRKQFSEIFVELLRRQLALKNILHPDEFDRIRNQITFEFKTDSMFEEAKFNEIMNGRLEVLSKINEYKGQYYSVEYIRRNILHQSDEEIKEIEKQIEQEKADGTYDDMNALDAAQGSNDAINQAAPKFLDSASDPIERPETDTQSDAGKLMKV